MVIEPAGLCMEGEAQKVAGVTASQLYEWTSSVLTSSDSMIHGLWLLEKLLHVVDMSYIMRLSRNLVTNGGVTCCRSLTRWRRSILLLTPLWPQAAGVVGVGAATRPPSTDDVTKP